MPNSDHPSDPPVTNPNVRKKKPRPFGDIFENLPDVKHIGQIVGRGVHMRVFCGNIGQWHGCEIFTKK